MRKDQHPHHHDSRQCRELFERMSEYLDNELDDAGVRIFEEHLHQCLSCQACLETLKRTIALCRSLPSPGVGETFSRRLRETLARFTAASDQ